VPRYIEEPSIADQMAAQQAAWQSQVDALTTQTNINRSAAHPGDWVWSEQISPDRGRGTTTSEANLSGSAGNWYDPNLADRGGLFGAGGGFLGLGAGVQQGLGIAALIYGGAAMAGGSAGSGAVATGTEGTIGATEAAAGAGGAASGGGIASEAITAGASAGGGAAAATDVAAGAGVMGGTAASGSGAGYSSPSLWGSLTSAFSSGGSMDLSSLSNIVNIAGGINSLTGGAISGALGGPTAQTGSQVTQAADPFAGYRGGLAKMYSDALTAGNQADITKMPGYSQFESGVMNPALEASKRSAAASGMLQSGNEQIALEKTAQQGYYGFMTDYLNRLAQGSGAANNPATAVGMGVNANNANMQGWQQGFGQVATGLAGYFGSPGSASGGNQYSGGAGSVTSGGSVQGNADYVYDI
jgi:hypothetical protein